MFIPTSGNTIIEEREIEEKKGDLVIGKRKAYFVVDENGGSAPVGHEIIMAKYAGTDFTYDGKKYTIVDNTDIKAYK